MKSLNPPHVGMRKVKSLIAITITFIIWQLIRIPLPQLEAHPIYAYIYAVIEIRDTAEKSKSFGFLRIKATLIGLVTGLAGVAASIWLTGMTDLSWLKMVIDLILILIATLIALCASEVFDCQNFCGVAAVIAIICMVSHTGEDRYLYAIMRVAQTLIAVFSAIVVNSYIGRRTVKSKVANNQ